MSLLDKVRLLEESVQLTRLAALADLIRAEADRLHQQKVDLTAAECKRLQAISLQEVERLSTQIQNLNIEKSRLEREVSIEEKRREQLLSRPMDQVLKENLRMSKELKELSNIWCIRQGDYQGGGWDKCYHFRADSEDQVEALRKTSYRYNSGIKKFAFQDIRGKIIQPPSPSPPPSPRCGDSDDG